MTSATIIAFLAIASATVAAYGLSENEAYAEIFSDETLMETSDSLSALYSRNGRSRFTRGAGGKHHGMKPCCGTKEYKPTEEDIKAFKECKPEKNENPNDASAEDKKLMWKAKFACASQCLGEKKGNVDAEGYVKEEEFKKSATEYFNDPALKDIVEAAINKCVPIANEAAKEHGAVDSDGKKCNSAFGIAIMCVRFEIETCCPPDQQVKGEQCDAMRAKIKAWQDKVNSKSER